MNLSGIVVGLLVAVLTGGVGVKILERYFTNEDEYKERENDIEGQYLEANIKLRHDLFEKVEKLEKQIETWRERYGYLYNEAQDQKDIYRSLRRDYEELKGMHEELKAMHEELKVVHKKREYDYEELRLQHEQILKTCEELRLEVSRFEKQVDKKFSDVRKEVEAAVA